MCGWILGCFSVIFLYVRFWCVKIISNTHSHSHKNIDTHRKISAAHWQNKGVNSDEEEEEPEKPTNISIHTTTPSISIRMYIIKYINIKYFSISHEINKKKTKYMQFMCEPALSAVERQWEKKRQKRSVWQWTRKKSSFYANNDIYRHRSQWHKWWIGFCGCGFGQIEWIYFQWHTQEKPSPIFFFFLRKCIL